MSWKCKVLLWQSDTRLCSGRYWKRIVRMCLGIGGEKMELLEMLENIEIAYHNLAVHYSYALKLDTAKRKELYYRCEDEFKTLKRAVDRAENLEETFRYSSGKLSKATKIYSDLEGKMKEYKIIGINFPERKIYFWVDFAPMYVEFDNYKEIWWLKEDKSE